MQNEVLKNLVQTYLATFSDLGIETWLMHGSLLGWWWGKKVRWFGIFLFCTCRELMRMPDPAVGH